MIDSGLIKNEIDQQVFTHVHGTRKWTMFISIAGFVFLTLLLLVFIGMPFISQEMYGAGLGIAMIVPMMVVIAVYFFPIYFLYQFSRLSKKAITQNDTAIMAEAFKFLKFHYKYMGIFLIVIICIYIVMAILMVSTGLFQPQVSM